MKYDEYGREIPDDTPVEIPIRFKSARAPSIQELIAIHVRAATQVERVMGKKEDEDDFEEEQEIDDILTPYELHAYAGEADAELRRAKVAEELVKRARKGKVDEKGIGRSAEGGKETPPGTGGSNAVGSADKEVGETGRKVASDDRGAS